jgi:hypothetical protein
VLLLGLLDPEGNQELGKAAQLGPIVLKDQRHGLAQVVDKVPAVGDLNGLGSAVRSC